MRQRCIDIIMRIRLMKTDSKDKLMNEENSVLLFTFLLREDIYPEGLKKLIVQFLYFLKV